MTIISASWMVHRAASQGGSWFPAAGTWTSVMCRIIGHPYIVNDVSGARSFSWPYICKSVKSARSSVAHKVTAGSPEKDCRILKDGEGSKESHLVQINCS